MKAYAIIVTMVAVILGCMELVADKKLDASREKQKKLEHRVALDKANLVSRDATILGLEMELNETKEINRLLEKTTIKKPKKIDPMIASLKKMPCKIDQLRWAARIEGEAGVPPLTLKALSEFTAGNGPEPKLTRRQQKAIVRGYDKHPYPKCDQRPCDGYFDCDDDELCVGGYCQEEP